MLFPECVVRTRHLSGMAKALYHHKKEIEMTYGQLYSALEIS